MIPNLTLFSSRSQMTNTIVMDVLYTGNYHFANCSELVVQITCFTVINLFHCDKCGKFPHKLLSANIPLHVVQQRFYATKIPSCSCCHPTGCCYNNVMKDSHCCVKRAIHPNWHVCFGARNLHFNETSP